MSTNPRNNVPISLLLSLSNDDESQQAAVYQQQVNNAPGQQGLPVRNAVSQFQATFGDSRSPSTEPNGIQASRPHSQHEIITIDSDSNDSQQSSSSARLIPGLGPPQRERSKPKKPVLIKPNSNLPILVPKSNGNGTSHSPSPNPPQKVSPLPAVKQFQTTFSFGGTPDPAAGSPPLPISKTSINSIINIDDEPTKTDEAPKKKRAPAKKKDGETAPKRKKPNPEKSSTPTDVKKKKVAPKTENGASTERKKPGPKPKKKTPEQGALAPGATTGSIPQKASNKHSSTKSNSAGPSPPPKPSIHPTMTTDKSQQPTDIKLAAPKFDDLDEILVKKEESQPMDNVSKTEGQIKNETTIGKEEEKNGVNDKEEEKEKEKAKVEPPIISLNIPLIDPNNPKPGQSEVIINVLKLAEDKYGWSTIHPNAKSAIDLMDEMIDEDEDIIEEDEDDDLHIVESNSTEKQIPANTQASKQKKKEDEELTEEQLVRQHEVKMIRKVGKYDYEDPFIDDEELQWEEEISSTKEGFFVYWGPLVDDRSLNTGSNKKGSSKSKK
ncbi:histone promoter control 2 [Hyphopichia burtonii NRRL Y-1933]|uniref:Histone promoter control 2 n=1 Tax=Hyphopichia burtonii NRRL Y-1933 TaxID=984485 RepID=A0A1E4RP62_9ASCO|nr:histone promoter control 2 [Hyphopichia burtonii NRRL Y-1933]ODV69001.1 histone promoter control 2 [Hyphopichia burtonii NRRL Y-1933]